MSEDGGGAGALHGDPSSPSSISRSPSYSGHPPNPDSPDGRTSQDSAQHTSSHFHESRHDDLGRESPTSMTRMSIESITTPGGAASYRGNRRRESLQESLNMIDTSSPTLNGTEVDTYVEDVVQPGFDEAILRALCDMDVSRAFRSIYATWHRTQDLGLVPVRGPSITRPDKAEYDIMSCTSVPH